MTQYTLTSEPAEMQKYGLSGHEDFPFRYGWPAKGVRYLSRDRHIFSKPDAPMTLGVGKNMVTSIRHWLLSLKLAETPGKGEYVVTPLGERLCGESGWDPYLEDPGTLWLLHWQLARNAQRSGTWHFAFTRWHVDTFTREDLVAAMSMKAIDQGIKRATANTIKKDVGTFIRTYAPVQRTRTWTAEDAFSCPLVELGLISRLDTDLFYFSRGVKPTLPAHIFLFALVEYCANGTDNVRTITFENLTYGGASPGAAFKLTENPLWELLEDGVISKYFDVDATAGQRNIIPTGTKLPNPLNILSEYYG